MESVKEVVYRTRTTITLCEDDIKATLMDYARRVLEIAARENPLGDIVQCEVDEYGSEAVLVFETVSPTGRIKI